MSHCLNEVKVLLLLIAEILIVVCPWDEKGKFSKNSSLFDIFGFRSRDYPGGLDRDRWSGNKINESFYKIIIFRKCDLGAHHQQRTRFILLFRQVWLQMKNWEFHKAKVGNTKLQEDFVSALSLS